MKYYVMSMLFTITGLSGWCQQQDPESSYLYYQRYASAENASHAAIATNPDDGKKWLTLTKSYILEGDAVSAADSLKKAPATVQEDPFFSVSKGWVLLANSKNDSAALYFDKAIDETKGKNADILAAIADAYINTSQGLDIAVADLEKAIKRDKGNAALYVKLGNAYRKLQKPSEAYQAYTTAIEKDKNYAEAYYRLGEIFQSQKNPEMYLKYFNDAVNADKNYGPALYELYQHYLYTEPAKAMEYFKSYEAVSDRSAEQAYALTDLLYLNKQYKEAIDRAQILTKEKDAPARLHKLIAYSFAELKDSTNALLNMRNYFRNAADTQVISKDYETMAELFIAQGGNTDSVIAYYEKAVAILKQPKDPYPYFQKLATLAKSTGNYAEQARWLGRYYMGNDKATNIDLFNWGVAAYRGEDYLQADSAFRKYSEKYPDQSFGYYWLARSNAAIDTSMTEGRAVPHYQKLIDVIGTDSLSANDKKWLTEAYSYLAAYETNTQKDYQEAIDYFEKVLEIDPENNNAKKYIAVLQDNLKQEPAKKEETDAQR